MGMTFSSAYLAPRQMMVWLLRRDGLSQAEIGRRLGVQRQVVYEQFHIIDEKMRRALTEAAQTYRLDVRRIDTVNGILEAYSHAYDSPVIVSFSKANGVQVWFLYEGRCDNCGQSQECSRILKAEAEERGVKLTEEDLQLQPTELGRRIFSIITRRLL